VRRFTIDGGFVQQDDLHLVFDGGRTASLPACIVAKVSNGVITRIDGYLDGPGATAAFAPPWPHADRSVRELFRFPTLFAH